MKNKPVLISKCYCSQYPTQLPVYFFGMPEGTILALYARFYAINFNETGLEFVFAELEDFTMNILTGEICHPANNKINISDFNSTVNQREPRLKIIKVHRKLKSFDDAIVKLNKMVSRNKMGIN